MPAKPDGTSADFARYWDESATWWDNWAHNLTVAMILFPGLVVVIGLLLAALTG